MIRSSILALSVVCLAVGMHLIIGWPLRWSWIASAALVCVATGAVLVLRPRMTAAMVARRLDRRFALNEQLTTALELGPQAEGVGAYLQEQSRRTVAQIRRQVSARQGFPWTDLGLALALVALLVGLLALSGIGSALTGMDAEPLPPLAQAPEPAERFPEEPFQPPPGSSPGTGPGESAASGPDDAASIAALANALRDQSVTRPVAEALDQGALGEAASRLRELADQAGGISDQSRAELAQELREAADQIAQSNPELADQVRESAEGIGPASPSPAEALESLAESVEQLGESQGQQPGTEQGQGQQPGEAGQQGQGVGAGASNLPGEQREGSGDRLGVDGVPLELESDGSGDAQTEGDPQALPSEGGGTGASGGFSRGSESGERVEAGDDPLRIPADLRDVVQDYFSP